MATVKFFVVVVLLLCSTGQNLANFKAYFPVSNETTHPHLVFGTLPALKEFTCCSWIRLFYLSNSVPHLFSYATKRTDDEIALFFYALNTSVVASVQVIDHYVSFNCSSFGDWNEVSWSHICASWIGADGSTKFSVNGKLCSPLNTTYGPVSSGETILEGGIVIIGQDQGTIGSGFDVHEGWYGDITGVNLWSEVLNEDQIREAGKCEGKRNSGTVIAWSKTPMSIHDNVVIREAEVCKP